MLLIFVWASGKVSALRELIQSWQFLYNKLLIFNENNPYSGVVPQHHISSESLQNHYICHSTHKSNHNPQFGFQRKQNVHPTNANKPEDSQRRKTTQ